MTAIPDGFERITPDDLERNPFRLIAEDWFLLTAGTEAKGLNTMTASWGGLGELWNRRVAFVFVRPQRYTMRFMEANPVFTMSFFDGAYRETLEFCGSHSGENVDKVAQTGLTPFQPADGATAFLEAGLVLVCAKLHTQDLDPSRFLDPSIEGLYPQKGYHRLYVGEITGVLRRRNTPF